MSVAFNEKIFEEKIHLVNVGLKEYLDDRPRWLQWKVYDELHMNRWLVALLFDKHLPTGIRLLDVGAGYGGFSSAIAAYGFEVTALEMNPALAEICMMRATRFNRQIEVIPTAVEDYKPTTNYNIITLWNVLEHVDNPAQTLHHLRSILMPGGAIYLNVMNRYSLIDPHFHLPLINFLPDPLRIWVCQAIRPSSGKEAYKMTFADLHYFTPRQFTCLAAECGLAAHQLDGFSTIRRIFKQSVLFRLTPSLES